MGVEREKLEIPGFLATVSIFSGFLSMRIAAHSSPVTYAGQKSAKTPYFVEKKCLTALALAPATTLSFEPAHHGPRDQDGGVLLDEMAGVGDGHEGEVAVDPVPGVVEGAGEEGFVPKAVDQEDRAGDGRGSRGGEGPPRCFAGVARVVGFVVVQHAFH